MAAGGTFVVDASVVAEILLGGPGKLRARSFLLEAPAPDGFIAPRIVVAEVAAAITRAVRHGALKPQEARAAYATWMQMLDDRAIRIVPDDDLLRPAFDLSLSLHHPLHDCIYVALARSESAGIAMCDAVLARKCRALGIASETIAV
ncbi:MAG TPA: type II toxin-antitoxin system VapC family toxin [Rhizomicrobium sp.]|nr:type II toxin-antitoxin system VapC family toxin [Rhizomicrobium sp.]